MSIALSASPSLKPSSSALAGVMPRFWLLASLFAGVDLLTKAMATGLLRDGSGLFLSERVGFLLVYNTGTAGGFSIGPYTWAINFLVTVGAVAMVIRIVKALAEVDPRSTLPLSLVSGGALGNLASLVVGPEGVADFIAVQITENSTIVLNVADLFLWTGALLLAPVVLSLLSAIRAERQERVVRMRRAKRA